MAIKTLYISKVGKNYKISEHFTLGEMACKDGSDKVRYSEELISKLEELRSYVGGTITINSGYRTPTYNKKVGGGSFSQHIKGLAADIVVKRNGNVISAKKICCLCQKLGFRGIGFISDNATHVDMRPSGSYRGDERHGYSSNVNGDFYSYFNITKGQIEALKASNQNEEEKQTEEDEDMTQEKFNELMNGYLKGLTKESPAGWSKEARDWAEKTGIIKGTGNGMDYKSFVTREQMVEFLYRLAHTE